MKLCFKTIAIALSVFLFAVLLAKTDAFAAETIDSGVCGERLIWSLDNEGVLSISGTGQMDDYTYSSNTPWFSYISLIKSVVITDGVTSIGNHAFSGCKAITGITMPNTITSIGDHAFYGCSCLSSVIIPDSVTNIGKGVFMRCNSLINLIIPNNIESLGAESFSYCSGLWGITIPKSIKEIGENAFNNCIRLRYVFYDGTQENWDAISIKNGNETLDKVRMRFLGTELPKLDAPTDLGWGRNYGLRGGYNDFIAQVGCPYCKIISSDSVQIELKVYGEAQGLVYTAENTTSNYIWSSFQSFLDNPRKSDTYYFSVRSVGDGVNYDDSDEAISGKWIYVAPEAELPTPTNSRWDKSKVSWDVPDDSSNIAYYQIRYSFSSTLGEEPISSITASRVTDNPHSLTKSQINKNGVGYYFFQIRAISSDITVCQNSPWTELNIENYYCYDGVSSLISADFSSVTYNSKTLSARLGYNWCNSDADVFVTIYQDGQMVALGTTRVPKDSTSSTIIIPISDLAGNYQIKAFFLNTANYTPLGDKAETRLTV